MTYNALCMQDYTSTLALPQQLHASVEWYHCSLCTILTTFRCAKLTQYMPTSLLHWLNQPSLLVFCYMRIENGEQTSDIKTDKQSCYVYT